MKACRHILAGAPLLRAATIASLIFWLILLNGCGRSGDDSQATTPTTGSSQPDPSLRTTRAPARPPVIVAATPAPKPTGSLPAGASCVTAECHASFATASHIHAPVAERACDSCHQGDIGKHQFPLKRSPADSCTFCHSVSGTTAHQHKALEQGCNACHDPHASGTKFLLKADTIEHLCLSCHDMPFQRFAHRPFAQGQCTLCHQPHQSDNAMLLRGGEGADHCFTCHGDLKQSLAASSQVHAPAARDCRACHGAHTTENPHLLTASIEQTCTRCHEAVQEHASKMPVQHAAMTEASSCLNCHAPHVADHSLLMRQRMDNVCLTCHDRPIQVEGGRTVASMKAELLESKFRHGATRAGDCSSCHDAHGAPQHSLLVRAFPESSYARFDADKYELCFYSCHSPELVQTERTSSLTNFRDGDVNLHFLHVNRDEKGRSCKTCHSIHGSNLPNHMASEVAFERSGWAMPIGFEKQSDGGSCAPGCHAPREYRRGETPTSAPAEALSKRGVP